MKWLLRLNPLKCDSIVISNKRSPILPSYHLDSSVILHHPVIQYFGIIVDTKLNWNEHCKYVSAKATKALNFLHHCLFNAPSSIKSTAYKCIVCPVMECASPVWDPHTAKNINALESVQRRAAHWASNSRWIPSSHCWSKSSDECIQASDLPFNSVTPTLLFVAFMIVSTTGIPYHLVNIFSCPKLPQGVTLYLSGL